MERKKEKWLERSGIQPMTEDILVARANKIYERFPERANQWVEDARKRFTHYRRYGQEIVAYTKGYLENTSLDELKRKHWKNIKLFVINRNWPLKQIRGWWIRRWFTAHLRKY